MLPHVLTNFVKMKLNLTVFFSINNLPKINNGAQEINLDKYKWIGTHWIALYVNGDIPIWTYPISQQIKKSQKTKIIE